MSIREIAARDSRALSTVKNQCGRLYAKLGIHRITDLLLAFDVLDHPLKEGRGRPFPIEVLSLRAKCYNLFRQALRLGFLKKQPCELCGFAPAQAHHADYAKPLEVKWLCFRHHQEEHKRLRERKRKYHSK
jgi:hypothetical protein